MKMGSTEELDDVDLQIIDLLQEDSRSSFRDIATKLKKSAGTVYNHIKKLEDKKVVKSYTIVVDPAKVGYDLTAVILIQAEGKYLPDVESEISNISNVISVYDITGDFDIAVTARFKDRAGLNAFIKSLLKVSHVKKTVTNVALNVIKEDFRIRVS